MTTTNKYRVHRCASGWGVWDAETGIKIKGFPNFSYGRIMALEYMYALNGWNLPKAGFR